MLRDLSTLPHVRPVAKAAPVIPLPRLRRIPPADANRILCFDIENRPLSYWYDGRCTAEVTAIAWAWTDTPEDVQRRLLSNSRWSAIHMLSDFAAAYAEAGIVTGHYISRHDLGIVQGALIEHGLPRLGAKLVSDTRVHLAKFQDLPKSQEALAAMLGVRSPKESMSQADWREANRLTGPGMQETMRRVVGDVRQHMELREALLERGLLGAARWWHPGGAKAAA